jgi:hypothetical protein
MALFSFGKKDKKPTEVPPTVAKTQPTPPKIQNPPGGGAIPPVKPPQPTGLMPATIKPGSAVTTQPMAVPRTPTGGLKPSRPGASGTRSTQRIVLPTPPGARANNQTRSLQVAAANGRINLPIGMILRNLPPEVLAADISEFETTGAAATEVGLPMNMILGQLPSGKVEMTLQELIPHFPPGYLQPTDALTNYLSTMVNLPLMDVVMRIPPDLLALRPDQKDVDASVINMADPFTEEILREQAEASRRQTQAGLQPKIIEESQAPQEEFVPRDKVPVATVAPPRRPAVEPLNPSRTAATTLAAPPPPMPPVTKIPTPPSSGGPRASQQLLPPTPVRSFATPVSVPIPVPQAPSAFAPLPPPPPVEPGEMDAPVAEAPPPPPPQSTAPVPPVPRHTGPIPAPPPPRHTTGLPLPRRTGSIPTSSLPPEPESEPAASEVAAPEAAAASPEPAPEPAPETPGAPDANADDLARLAALAMAEMGEENEEPAEGIRAPEPAPMAIATQPVHAPVPEPTPEPAPVQSYPPSVRATVPLPPPTPAVAAEPEPIVAPTPTPMVAEAEIAPASVAFNLNTCSAEDMVQHIGCSSVLAEAVIAHRTKIGSYKKIEELLDVPGMTKEAYLNLTGEEPPTNRVTQSINELLNFPPAQEVSLKDVTDRIACWPDVTGCLLSQSSGLSLVGTVPAGVDKEAVVAFAPRMFEAINKSFAEVSGQETDALLIPAVGTSYHLFRSDDLYLIIMSRLPQMPERHMKVARLVLAALSARRD